MFVQGLHDIFQNIKGKTYVLLWAKNNKVLTENWRALSPMGYEAKLRTDVLGKNPLTSAIQVNILRQKILRSFPE